MVEAAPSPWWGTFIRLAFTTGLRVGEMLNLQWSDIQDGHVVVSAKRAGTFVVEGITYPILPWSCKSYRERRVPLHPNTAARPDDLHPQTSGPYLFLSLERLLGLQAARDVTQELPSAALVNNMLRDFRAVQGHARAILSERNVEPVAWTLGAMHDLRKSYVTLMARRVPMHELQKLMGHASITTTAEYYTEANQDVADAVVLAFAS